MQQVDQSVSYRLGRGVFFTWMPQTKLLPVGRLKMVHSNESMTDVKVLEVNHFEPAPPMHHGGASCGKKYPPALPNDQLNTSS